MGAHQLEELVDPGWAQALNPVRDQLSYMGNFLRHEIAEGRYYLPEGKNILRAFTFPFSQVRVLIVGQDPYPTPGHAMGMSFSVSPTTKPLPRSLINIFTEYSHDLGYPQPSCGDLTPWAEQGVLLLNRVLTVQPGCPGSHRGKGWERITNCAIEALVHRDQPLVGILWGRDAQTFSNMLSAHHCHVLSSAHPSPLSASRGFFGSRPFSRANQLLIDENAHPIEWRLP